MTAGLATLKLIQAPGYFNRLFKQAAHLEVGLQQTGASASIPVCSDHVGNIVGLYLDMDRRRPLLHDFAAAAQWVDLPAAPRPTYSRDPDDDVFFHTALHGKAEWLVSGDRDLLELPPTDWVFEILSPAQALGKWRQK